MEEGPGEATPLLAGPPPEHIELSELGGLLGFRYFHVMILAGGFLLNLVPASLVGPIPYVLREVQEEFGVRDAEASLLMSGVVFGSIIGVLVTGWSNDYLGRRITILMCVAAVACLGSLHMLVEGFWKLIALRTAIGVPYGGLIVLIAPYLIEFAADGARGFMSNASQLAWPLGSVLAISFVEFGEHNWRVDLSVCSVWAIAALLCLFAMPESPRWLFISGNEREGQLVLSRIFASGPVWSGPTCVGDAPVVRVEKLAVGSPRGPLKLLPELFGEELCPVTSTCSFLCMITTGVSNAGWVWGPTILAYAAHVEAVPLWVFLAAEFCGVLGMCLGMVLLDATGRRPVLVCAFAVGAALTFALVAGLTLEQAIGVWLLFGVQNGVMWAVVTTYFCEAFPTRIRGTGVGFSCLLGRVAGGLSPILLGSLLETSAQAAIVALGCVFLLGAVGAAAFMRETAHKSLADLQAA